MSSNQSAIAQLTKKGKGKTPKLRSKLRLQTSDPIPEGSNSAPPPYADDKPKDPAPSPTTALFAELKEAQETLDAYICLPVLEYGDSSPYEAPQTQEPNASEEVRDTVVRQARAIRSLRNRLLAYMSRS